jgi:23S rRNA (cytosine1962-C5)-methyltransferase
MLIPQHFADYELIDCGGFEKLERFGAYIVRRPEPKAIWAKSMSEPEWGRMADATFRHSQGAQSNPDERGTWSVKKTMPDRWQVNYNHAGLNLTLRLALTGFKHVGIFPEQAAKWDYIYENCKIKNCPKVLNLFAYTGAASLAARAAGAEVVHLDSIKQVVTWANANMQLSNLDGIRWLVDDAQKFVERQVRRNAQYQGIILDPPAYGRGPAGERWLLNDGILSLMQGAARILAPSGAFLVLNMYAMGISAVSADTLVRSIFGNTGNLQSGELGVTDRFGKRLPLSVFARYQSQ